MEKINNLKWKDVLALTSKELTEVSYRTWFLPLVPLDDNLRKLVKEVREVRAKNVSICLSAQSGVNVPEILMFIINNEIYRADYETVTYRILGEKISYDTCIEAVRNIAESGLFVE